MAEDITYLESWRLWNQWPFPPAWLTFTILKGTVKAAGNEKLSTVLLSCGPHNLQWQPAWQALSIDAVVAWLFGVPGTSRTVGNHADMTKSKNYTTHDQSWKLHKWHQERNPGHRYMNLLRGSTPSSQGTRTLPRRTRKAQRRCRQTETTCAKAVKALVKPKAG